MKVYIRFIILKEHIQEESLSETSLLSTNVKGYLGVRAKKSPFKGPLLDPSFHWLYFNTKCMYPNSQVKVAVKLQDDTN